MSGYVVDASAAVKWLVSEAFFDEAAPHRPQDDADRARAHLRRGGQRPPSHAAAATLRALILGLQPRPANSHELYSNRRCIIIAAEPVRLG